MLSCGPSVVSREPTPLEGVMEGDTPLCLYRNCITFELEHTTEIVTLVDMFSHIAVHVDQMSSIVCAEIRDCVYSGIKSACSLLKCQCLQVCRS